LLEILRRAQEATAGSANRMHCHALLHAVPAEAINGVDDHCVGFASLDTLDRAPQARSVEAIAGVNVLLDSNDAATQGGNGALASGELSL
jgi:hypothetical protein